MERAVSVAELRKLCKAALDRYEEAKARGDKPSVALEMRINNLLTFTTGMTANSKVALSHEDLVALYNI